NLPLHSSRPLAALFVPGRIEFLGKHTDYAGGRSLICAAERGICALVWPREDATITMVDGAPSGSSAHASVEFALTPELWPEVDVWWNYPMTVARRVARNFAAPLRGAEIVFASDLP